MLEENRDRLVMWQRDFYADATGLRVHLGCGTEVYPGWINLDSETWRNTVGVDQGDLRDLNRFADSTVDVISCHHALEHIPGVDIIPTLQEWARVLKVGGVLDLAMPDIELTAKAFLANPSHENKWSYSGSLGAIYGGQFAPGMIHQGGASLSWMRDVLIELGFSIEQAFNYNANGTSEAFWILARKGERRLVHPTVLEQDVVMGTFTHRTTYLPMLLDSVRQHLPHIPFELVINNAPINANMTELLRRFRDTGKRYWLFLDDDIAFLDDRIIHNAVLNMIQNDWSLVGVHSTFEPDALESDYAKYKARIQAPGTRDVTFVTGYFMLADSHKIGHILPDMRLPDGNTSVDTSYSVAALSQGHRCGISNDLVYHVRKKGSWVNQDVIEPTNQYHYARWGPFYFQNAVYCGNVIEWQEAWKAQQEAQGEDA